MSKKGSGNKHTGLSKIDLLLIDDNAIFLQSLTRFITADPTLTVVGTATTAHTGLTLAKELRPDIVIVDLQMPEVSGFEFISLVRAQMPNLCILALTLRDEPGVQSAALKRGAQAFIVKVDIVQELVPLIHKLYEAGCQDH